MFDDASNGVQEGVRSEGAPAAKCFFAPRAATAKELTGFDAFVRDNWQPLMAKDGLTMRFLIPSHLADMEFRVQHVRADHVDGVPVEVFRLMLSNVFGWFVPGIDVYYSTQGRELGELCSHGLFILRASDGIDRRRRNPVVHSQAVRYAHRRKSLASVVFALGAAFGRGVSPVGSAYAARAVSGDYLFIIYA